MVVDRMYQFEKTLSFRLCPLLLALYLLTIICLELLGLLFALPGTSWIVCLAWSHRIALRSVILFCYCHYDNQLNILVTDWS